MRRALKAYQTNDGHWQRGPQNPGDTQYRVNMPTIDRFCAAMSNFQDELSPVSAGPGFGFGLSALAFMSQIFGFETVQSAGKENTYNSFKNGDGPATVEQKAEQIAEKGKKGSGHLTLAGLTYLELILAQWILGETSQGRRLGGVLVPQRWIDQLTKIIADTKAGRITQAEALVKFAKIS